MNVRLLLALAVSILPAPLLAREAFRIEPAEATNVGARTAPTAVPSHVFEASAGSPLAALERAETAESKALEDLAAWNKAGNRPRRNGFARDLPTASVVTLEAGAPPRGWVAVVRSTGERILASRVRVDGAWRLRLHLSEVHLPAGARLLVYGTAGVAIDFGEEAIGPDGDLWTPSVGGNEITLEVRLDAQTLSAPRSGFQLDRVMDIFDLMRTAICGTHVGLRQDTACVARPRLQRCPPCAGPSLLGHVSLSKFSADAPALVNDTDEQPFLPADASHCHETPGGAARSGFDDYRDLSRRRASTLPRVWALR